MEIISGDLIQLALEGRFDVIVHGCNCFCNMGSGIARQVRAVFPEAFKADCATKHGDRSKLGTCSQAVHHVTPNKVITIINGYTQYTYGKGINVDYHAVRSVFKYIHDNFAQMRIGYPMIGAGLAGGDWTIISKIIDEELMGCKHTLVKYVK